MRVLIVGCGYVGRFLAVELSSDGDTVFALRRTPFDIEGNVTTLQGDLFDPASLGVIPKKLDAVVYTVSADSSSVGSYRKAYVQGILALRRIFSSRADSSPRFLFASSTSVYGQSTGEWVDEKSATNPESFRGEIVLEGEAAVKSSFDHACSVRFGGIYGPGRTRLPRSVQEKTFKLPPIRPYFTNRIHQSDAAGVLRHLLRLKSVPTKVVAVDNDPADLYDVAEWVSRRVDSSLPAEVEAGWKRALGHKRCSNRLLRQLGYRFQFPTFREGYGPLLCE